MEAKKIIITGGATRIGAAIAKSLVNYDTKMVIHFNKSKSSALKLKKELEELGAETYLLKDGIIVRRHIGELNIEKWRQDFADFF